MLDILSLHPELIFNKIIRLMVDDGIYIFPIICSICLTYYFALKFKIKLAFSSFFLVFSLLLLSPFIRLYSSLGVDSFWEVFQFDLREALFYVTSLSVFSSFKSYQHFFWSAWLLIFLLMTTVVRFLEVKYKLVYSGVGLCIFLLFFTLSPFVYGIYVAQRLNTAAHLEIKNLEQNFLADLGDFDIDSPAIRNLSVFVYLGESTSSLNWSLYGYGRQTNQSLERFKKDDNFCLFFYTKVSSLTYCIDIFIPYLYFRLLKTHTFVKNFYSFSYQEGI